MRRKTFFRYHWYNHFLIGMLWVIFRPNIDFVVLDNFLWGYVTSVVIIHLYTYVDGLSVFCTVKLFCHHRLKKLLFGKNTIQSFVFLYCYHFCRVVVFVNSKDLWFICGCNRDKFEFCINRFWRVTLFGLNHQ